MGPDDTEARLVTELRAGNRAEVATAIVRDYGPGLLGYLGAMLRDDEAARDAFSELAEELWKSLPRFAFRSSLKTWAYSIAYHCVLRARRAQARRRTRPLHDSEYSKLAAAVSRSFARSAADRKLDALRATLDDEDHTLLVLRINRGMAWHDIGVVVGADATTARKRFQRLKERLRRDAQRAGLIDAD
jgi:RNA polymerase sigma-70 factor (ECF subfamily)